VSFSFFILASDSSYSFARSFACSVVAVFGIAVTSLILVTEQARAVNCINPKEICIESGGTRTFDGVAVTLPCWRYETTWECHEEANNNCKLLRDQGCSQTSARCIKMFGGICAVQEETYDCPTAQMGVAKGIRIGDEFFCMSGDCAAVNPKTNKNFSKVAAYAAVLNAAAEDIKKQNSQTAKIFTGKVMECSRSIANAKNCCADSGWAKGLLGGCDSEENELAQARESGIAVAAGNGSNHEYCYNRKLGICTSYHQVYCVFPSKIAQIVQVAGRKNQLGISFGLIGDDDAQPDCRGITPEELSKLNFEKMDFSSFYKDILRKTEAMLPDPKIIEQKISSSMRNQYETTLKNNN